MSKISPVSVEAEPIELRQSLRSGPALTDDSIGDDHNPSAVCAVFAMHEDGLPCGISGDSEELNNVIDLHTSWIYGDLYRV